MGLAGAYLAQRISIAIQRGNAASLLGTLPRDTDLGQIFYLTFGVFTTRLATILILQAAGAGYASPTVLVTRPVSRVAVEWLPVDNQTVYRLSEGETRSLELNTSSISQAVAFITISPCSYDFYWALYSGRAGDPNGHLSLKKESNSSEMHTIPLIIEQHDRYVLKLSSKSGGAAVVSVRGEATRQVRLRLRVRSRRRLAANWEPSPIDPQETTYCVVASRRKNYTSLCAAQFDIKSIRENKIKLNSENMTRELSAEVDNKIETSSEFNMYERNFKSVFRKKKFSRSTRVTDEDTVIACVGDRIHHLIENLDPSTTYYVSVFGVGKDRRSGSLLATSKVCPKTSTAKRLRENISKKFDVRGRIVYYFKTIGSSEGLWVTVSTCGGAVDVEVLVRGKRLHLEKNIDPQSKFFVPSPISSSSIQETSDEGSIQFDSSSEEARTRYVLKIMPSRWNVVNEDSISVELTVSTSRWGISTPELLGDTPIVRELRPQRTCKSIDIAFLPATHNATDVIRYCIAAREILSGEHSSCLHLRRTTTMTQCVNHIQRNSPRVIVQKMCGLKPGRKYAVHVTAALSRGSPVPYNVLYADTNVSCREE